MSRRNPIRTHRPGPRLAALLASGAARRNPVMGYEGVASDGEIVSLGAEGDEASIERYLAARPTPDTW